MIKATATRIKDNGQPDSCSKSGEIEGRTELIVNATRVTATMLPDGSGMVKAERFILGSWQELSSYTIEPWDGQE